MEDAVSNATQKRQSFWIGSAAPYLAATHLPSVTLPGQAWDYELKFKSSMMLHGLLPKRQSLDSVLPHFGGEYNTVSMEGNKN
jgi:hypothetical protein